VKIRTLTSDDAQAFQALRLEGLQTSPTAFGSSYEEEVDRPLQVVAERLEAKESYVCGAFNENGQLIGVVGLHRERYKKAHHKAFIWGMYVSPEFRRQGIGRALLETAIARAREMPGLRQIGLSVNTSNQTAHSLYQSCGFEEYGVEQAGIRVDGNYYGMAHMILQLGKEA